MPNLDYEGKLNRQQWEAVDCPPGPSLVIAGAGSGKTRTLTHRVAHLIERGIAPRQILLLTFTNKAAKEMMDRVSSLLERELSSLWGGTFHSIGNRILRRHAPAVGYSQGFTIMDREDAKSLLKTCIEEEKGDKSAPFPKAEVVGNIFSQAVNRMIPLASMIQDRFSYFERLTAPLESIRQRYRARKIEGGLMDFDDLLALWMELFEKDENARRQYQRRFRYLLVDEYQDTNKLQGLLIDRLAEDHGNVMAVGDEDQSVYSWRGADFRNILEFPKRYSSAKIFKIETNYRSTPEILRLANAIISANGNQFEKRLLSARDSGRKPVLAHCEDADEQARFVAQRVLELREERGENLGDMAVLYRSHRHAMELQLELTKQGIPFVITSGIRFFEQAHVKDATAYLKMVANPRDEVAFRRLTKMMPGIGDKMANKLWSQFLRQLPNNLVFLRKKEPKNGVQRAWSIAERLANCAPAVPKKARTAWARWSASMSQLEAEPMRRDPGKMIEFILDAGYQEYLQNQFENYQSRLEDLQQLAQYAQTFENLEDFLSQLALETNLETEDGAASTNQADRLRLTTIHQAKGLEFSVVFIIMLCQGLFPFSRSLRENEAGEEEERRLFYVAATRAKNELYLSFPKMRFAPGQQDNWLRPSQFLSELSEECYESWELCHGEFSRNAPF